MNMQRHKVQPTVLVLSILCLAIQVNFGNTQSFDLILVSHEGDSAFLPCSYPNANNIPLIWEIDGATYVFGVLPNRIQRPIPSALFINDVSLEHTANYTCYSHSQRLYSIRLLIMPSENNGTTSPPPITDLRNTVTLNLTATETNVLFLPCVPAIGTHDVTVWRIDGVTYPVTELPCWHSQRYGGIIVNPAMSSTMGTVYECYKYTTDNESIRLLYTIYLSLQTKENQTPVSSQFYASKVTLISRKVSLNSTHKTFGFKIDSVSDLSSESQDIEFITKLIDIAYPNIFLWNDKSNNLEPIFSIPSKFFQNTTAYSTTYAKNLTNGNEEPFARLGYLLRTDGHENINSTCIVEGQTSCVNLPENKNGLLIVWPTHPESDEDCVCPVFLERELEPKFKECYCFAFNLTTYNVELQDNDRICWKDLDRDSNDTKVLLIKAKIVDDVNSRLIASQKRTIIVPGPLLHPPNLTYYDSNNSVCADTKSVIWSPVLGLKLKVHDVTGRIVLSRDILKDSVCLKLNDLSQNCAPFYVEIAAFSQCFTSLQSTFQGRENGSTCECLQNCQLPIWEQIVIGIICTAIGIIFGIILLITVLGFGCKKKIHKTKETDKDIKLKQLPPLPFIVLLQAFRPY